MKSIRLLFLAAVAFTGVLTTRADLATIITNVLSSQPAQQAIPRRSSIILIQCHGLAYGDLSCYGQTNYQTPNFDRLAAEGMRFTDYRAGSTDFSAAQAAAMLGKSSKGGAISPSEITVAQELQLAGYHTGLIGEWTLGDKPWTQGFDEFAGFLNADEGRNYYAESLWHYAPNSILNKTNNQLETYNGRETIYADGEGHTGAYTPDVFIKAMQNFVNANQPDQFNRYRPFFLCVNLPAPRSASPSLDNFPVPSDAPFTSEKWPQAAKNRAALLTRLDDGIGQLLAKLEKLQLTNNVAIFFTSASGSEKFASAKMNFIRPDDQVTDGKPRVPMIVRWPGTVPAGRVSKQPWSAEDFAPTALQIGYAKPAPSITGISIFPKLTGQLEKMTNAAPDMPGL